MFEKYGVVNCTELTQEQCGLVVGGGRWGLGGALGRNGWHGTQDFINYLHGFKIIRKPGEKILDGVDSLADGAKTIGRGLSKAADTLLDGIKVK